MSALEPLRASILMGRVGPPSVGSVIYCAGAHALFWAARVGFGTLSGVGPYVTLSVETEAHRYNRWRNWIGLPLNRVCACWFACDECAMFVFYACILFSLLVVCCIGNHTILLTRLFACHSCGAPYSMV